MESLVLDLSSANLSALICHCGGAPVLSKNSWNFATKSHSAIGSVLTPRTRANSANSGFTLVGTAGHIGGPPIAQNIAMFIAVVCPPLVFFAHFPAALSPSAGAKCVTKNFCTICSSDSTASGAATATDALRAVAGADICAAFAAKKARLISGNFGFSPSKKSATKPVSSVIIPIRVASSRSSPFAIA